MTCSGTNWILSDKASRLLLAPVHQRVHLIQGSFTDLQLQSHIHRPVHPDRLPIITIRKWEGPRNNYHLLNHHSHAPLRPRICILHILRPDQCRPPHRTGTQMVGSLTATHHRRTGLRVLLHVSIIRVSSGVDLFVMEYSSLTVRERERRCPMMDFLGCLCYHSWCFECPPRPPRHSMKIVPIHVSCLSEQGVL